jgi:hypothetical protein
MAPALAPAPAPRLPCSSPSRCRDSNIQRLTAQGHIPPGDRDADAEPGRQAGERLPPCAVGQHQQCLLPGAELVPTRADLPAVMADYSGGVGEGLRRQRQRGTVESIRAPGQMVMIVAIASSTGGSTALEADTPSVNSPDVRQAQDQDEKRSMTAAHGLSRSTAGTTVAAPATWSDAADPGPRSCGPNRPSRRHDLVRALPRFAPRRAPRRQGRPGAQYKAQEAISGLQEGRDHDQIQEAKRHKPRSCLNIVIRPNRRPQCRLPRSWDHSEGFSATSMGPPGCQ